MNVNDLKRSRFLTKNDVQPPRVVTIADCKETDVGLENTDPEYRWALYFKELEKPLILNITNGQIIADIVGSEESDDWIGQKIVLYFEPNVSFGGKRTGGIRVRAPKGQSGIQSAADEPAIGEEELPPDDGSSPL